MVSLGGVVAVVGSFAAVLDGVLASLAGFAIIVALPAATRPFTAKVRRVVLTPTAIMVTVAQGTVRVLWDDVRAVVPVERRLALGPCALWDCR